METALRRAFCACLLLGATLADVPHPTDATAYNAGALGSVPNQTFHSSPIVAPVFQVNILDADAIDPAGYIFLNWKYDDVSSPMIFRSDDLSLVYADQRYTRSADVRVQTIDGAPHLTFWEGGGPFPYGNGHAVVLDETYQVLRNITPIGLKKGVLVDQHEHQFTDEGTVLITVYNPIPYDLSPLGGPEDGTLLDGMFQEIVTETNELVFSWSASDHWPVEALGDWLEPDDESMGGFDFYHINSVEKYDGNYLVSSRFYDHVILVDGTDGSVIWTLGGKWNNFTDLSDGRAVGIAVQHHARFRDGNSQMTLFNNAISNNSIGCRLNCSHGLRLQLDYDTMTAEVVEQYFHPRSLQNFAMGSHQVLDSGNAFIGWGAQPVITEHRGGVVVMDVQVGPLSDSMVFQDTSAYRVFKMDWTGSPKWGPSIAIDGGTVYLSWNGATEVQSWVLRGGDSADAFGGWGFGSSVVGESERRGFETAIELEGALPKYLRADARGAWVWTLGSTSVLETATGKTVLTDGG